MTNLNNEPSNDEPHEAAALKATKSHGANPHDAA